MKTADIKADKIKFRQLVQYPLALQKMLIHALEIHQNDIVSDFKIHDSYDGYNGCLIANVSSCAVYDYLTCILGAEDNGYAINNGILSAVDFGLPQKRRRFVIIGIKKDFTNEVEMPKPSKNISMTTVEDAIWDLAKVVPQIDIEADDDIGKRIDREDLNRVTKLKVLRDSKGIIYNHIIPKTGTAALKRFSLLEQGQNFHNLPDIFKSNTYTNADRTQNTVYQRLNYDEPSGTVINVRKSMWIHPTINRAISVREAARLQTFPDSFRFFGTKDAQYQQVGNAVPPMLAKAIAEKVLSYIDD